MNWTNEDIRKSTLPAAFSWREMCRNEQRLTDLWSSTRTLYPEGINPEDWRWIKPALSKLAGWEAETADLRLRTADVWETAVIELTHLGG